MCFECEKRSVFRWDLTRNASEMFSSYLSLRTAPMNSSVVGAYNTNNQMFALGVLQPSDRDVLSVFIHGCDGSVL
jgi:hypothetical protein